MNPSPIPQPLAYIVVLTWNQCDLTMACLDSLSAVSYPADCLRIVVVDNGSTDGTSRAVRQSYSTVTVIENGDNLGYAAGNNVGIRYALEGGADCVCILNNDVIVDPGFLGPMISGLQENVQIGIATPLVYEIADSRQQWKLGSMVDWRSGTVQHVRELGVTGTPNVNSFIDVDVADGAALILKREVVERIGLLDEAFYLYFEETDWCLRARQAGYRIIAVPQSRVWHKVSSTLGPTSPAIDYYMVRNQIRFISRHWFGLQRARLLGVTIWRNLLTIAAYTVKSHHDERLPHRNARLMALCDALLGRWGKMPQSVERVCQLGRE